MSKDNILKQIHRLIYSSDSFQKIEALIEHMESPDTLIDGTLYSAMMSGIATTYAANFNRSDGVGPLPKMYEKFEGKSLALAHSQLLAARNQLYAHRDLTNTKSKDIDAYKVEVWLQGGFFLQRPIMIDIPSSKLPEIKRLIKNQRKKLQVDLDTKLARIIDKNRKYKEGEVWVMGVDFP